MQIVQYNGDLITWSIPASNLTPNDVNNFVVTDVASSGTQYVSHTVSKGTYSPTTGIWTIGTVAGNTTEYLKITVKVVDISLAPFTNTATATADGFDPNLADNEFTQTVEAGTCPPAGGSTAFSSGCLCVNLADNTTKCTKGITEWRLIISSVVNSISWVFDKLTGQASFTPVDPTEPITFEYDVFCVIGVDEFQVSCRVEHTIRPQLQDKKIFDHTVSQVKVTDLTAADIAVLQAQDPDIVVTDYCWQVIKNADGVVTSGIPLDCDPTIDNRTFVICTAAPCTNTACPDCPILTLPSDVQAQILVDTPGYVPEKGDVVFIQHPNATSVYTYNGSGWVKSSCGCVYKISQDADNDLILSTDNAPFFDLTTEPELIALQNKVLTAAAVTGTVNKVLTLTFQDGTTLTSPFTDIGTAGQSIVQVQDTCSVDLSIVGDGSVGNPYVISAETKNGDPLTTYIPGIISGGGTGFTFDVTSLFSEMCSAGCTATYTLGAYPTQVFANVSLVGTTLTYDVIGAAPGGSHFIDVIRECN